MVNKNICPCYGECDIVNNCSTWKNCRIKELFDDFYDLESLYLSAVSEIKELKNKCLLRK